MIWLSTAILFFVAAVTYLLKIECWWMFGLIATIISQILITVNWQDAKFGTISNLIILPAVLIGYFSWNFKNSFHQDVDANLINSIMETKMITDADLNAIPEAVKRYLKYTNVINKPIVRNFKVIFSGEMRGKDQKWFHFKSEQYNFTDVPTRLFFMKATMKSLPFAGYHKFVDGNASMTIKMFSQFPIVDLKQNELNQAETVTYFNDMCLLAPGSLIDKRIKWVESDSLSATAIFTNNGISITAKLLFNPMGQLINFISDDRYEVTGGKPQKLRFSTPVKGYKNVDGRNVISLGEAVWHYPEGLFVYGKFNLENIEYNLSNQ